MNAARTASLVCLTLACAAAPGQAQPGGDIYVSGLLHHAMGSVSSLTASGRRLTACCLGSSGQDGVEIRATSGWGLGSGIEIGPLLQTTGAVQAAFKGWDGTIKGTVRMQSHGNGSATCTADFPGATDVQYTMLDRLGHVLAAGTFPPTGVDFVNNIPCPDGSYPSWGPVVHESDFGQTYVTMELGCWGSISLGGSDASMMVLTPGLPPGTPYIGFDSMQITATGVTELTLTDATIRTFDAACYGVGAAQIGEECIGVPPPCAQAQRRLPVHNLGSSGQDGVSIAIPPPIGAQASENSNLTEYRTVGVSFSGVGVEPIHTAAQFGAKRPDWNITLLKLYDDEAAGARTLHLDYSGLGSAQCTARFFNTSGVLLASATLSSADSISCPTCPDGAMPTYSMDSYGVFTMQPCHAPWTCTISGGSVVAEVGRVTFSPVNPTVGAKPVTECVITSLGASQILVGGVSVSKPVMSSGLPHDAVGGAVLAPIDSSHLLVSNIGSSGQDGVSIDLHSAIGGGTTIDMTPMLGATGIQREIRCRPKGWDGTIKGQVRLLSSPDGTLSEVYDFRPMGASSSHWKLLDASGAVLAQGIAPTAVLTLGLTATVPAGATMNKRFYSGGGGGGGGGSGGTAARSAGQGFFDRSVSVSGLTPSPMAGVYGIEVDPDPCAGLPENCPPTWTNVGSMQLTFAGLSAVMLSGSHLRTFGVVCTGLGAAQLSEECSSGGGTCGPTERRLPVNNIGSSGQDGVSIDLGPSAAGGSVARSKKCPDCPPGHVTLIKFYDDAQRTFGGTHTDDPLTGGSLLSVDSTDVGSAQTLAVLRGGGGEFLTQYALTPLDALACQACPAPSTGQETWSWTTGRYTLRAGCPLSVSLPSGVLVAGVGSIDFQPIAPLSIRTSTRADVTSTDPDGFNIDSVTITPWCPADVNHDGQITPADLAVFVNTWFDSLIHGTLAGDFDGNLTVEPADIAVFVSTWFNALIHGC